MPIAHGLKSLVHTPFLYTRDRRIHISEPASLYISNTLRVVAISLVGVFLPIYIYNISPDYLVFHSNEVINGISWVLSYFLLRSISAILAMAIFGNALFKKFHFQLSMILSFVFVIVEILLWHLSQYNLFYMLLAGAIAGFKVVFYWIPYHLFFLKKTGHKTEKMGKKTSFRFFLTRVSSGFAPAIGGLIIVNYGFNVLFMVSIAILIVAAIPIALVVHDWEHHEHHFGNILKNFLVNKNFNKNTLGHFGEGIESIVYASFWPILLYFVLDSYVKIGFINTLSFLFSSVAVLLIGFFIDKHGTKKIHGIGVVVNSFSYLARMLFSNAPLYFSLDVLDRFFSGTVALPIMSGVYQRARKYGSSDYIMYRELCMHAGVVLAISMILVAVKAFVTWKWVFVFAIMGSMMTMLLEVDSD